MDTFAAIALSTEPPLEKILKTPPTGNATILTAPIWRQVMGISIWNSVIIAMIYLFGGIIGDLESFNFYTDKIDKLSPAEICTSDDAVKDLQAFKKAIDKS